MKIYRLVAIMLAATTVICGALFTRAAELDDQRNGFVTRALAVAKDAQDAQKHGILLADRIDQAGQTVQELDAVIAVRPDFVAAVKQLSDSMTAAHGKVDTGSQRTAAVSAQQSVLAERKDPQVVVAATATVRALVEQIDERVAAWERARVVRAAPAAAQAPSDSSAYARVRAALDRVGGQGVGLYESSSCAGGSAAACANSNGYIKYTAQIAGWSASRLNWAMAHELAHIYQFRVWGRLNDSAQYGSLFGNDPEFLANCMAAVRGYAGRVGCNGDQQAWASGIWVGVVR